MSVSSLLYLHKKTLSSKEIKNDVDFLLDLLSKEGSKRKRWQAYLDEDEEIAGDENLHAYSDLMEQLAYREVMVENFDEETALFLIWLARFGKLGELHDLGSEAGELEKTEHLRKNIHSRLQSDYVKEMLEKIIIVSLRRQNPENAQPELADFFDSLQRRGQLKTALNVLESRSLSRWESLVANELFEHLPVLLDHSGKFRSAKIFLRKNARQISQGVENHLKYENFSDKHKEKIIETKKAWKIFTQIN